MMWWNDGFGWAGWLVMTLMMLVFWGALIFGGIAVWKAFSRDQGRRNEPPATGPGHAERLLDERFARGEIDEEDYRRRRELLRTHH